MEKNDLPKHNEGFGSYTATETEIKHHLYNWVFHFNSYAGIWIAIPRNLYNQYWDDSNVDGIIRSKSIATLIEIIQKTEGDITMIEKIINAE